MKKILLLSTVLILGLSAASFAQNAGQGGRPRPRHERPTPEQREAAKQRIQERRKAQGGQGQGPAKPQGGQVQRPAKPQGQARPGGQANPNPRPAAGPRPVKH